MASTTASDTGGEQEHRNRKQNLLKQTVIRGVRVQIPLQLYEEDQSGTIEKISTFIGRLEGSIKEYDSLYSSGKIAKPIVRIDDPEVTKQKFPLLTNARDRNWDAVIKELCTTSLPDLIRKYQRVYWRTIMSKIGCGVYELPTKELMQVLCRVLLSLKAREVEEMGAGQGLFTAAIREYSKTYGSENYSKLKFYASNPPIADPSAQQGIYRDDTRLNWNKDASIPYSIDDMKERLFEEYDGHPDTIVVSWVPPRAGEQFEALFRKKLPRHVIFIGDSPQSSSSVTYEFILPALREGYYVSFIPLRGCSVFTEWQTRVQLNPTTQGATTVLTIISKDKAFTKEEVNKIVPECAKGNSEFHGPWNAESYSSREKMSLQMMAMLDSVAYSMWLEKYEKLPTPYTWLPDHGGFLSLPSL